MNKIAQINNKNITKKDKMIAFIYELICGLLVLLFIVKLNDIKMFLILLPFLVILTLIVHESIHISLFKLFGKDTKIKIINDKFKSIYIYQCNQNVYYTRLQTIIILLTPLISISCITIILFLFLDKNLVFPIVVNGIINAMGSMTDFILSIKLLTYKEKIFINYEMKETFTLNIFEKEKHNN